MSRNTNNKNISATRRVPYCKVCQDAGKPQSEYTSHWVKDLTGKTTCPTLLNTECRYCYNLGHTAKFCDVAKKNNRAEQRQTGMRLASHPISRAKKPQNAATFGTNGFAALCYDSETEEEVTNHIVNEYPSLCEPTKKVNTEVKTGWADIVAKPKEVKPVSKPGFIVLSDYIKKAPQAKVVDTKSTAPPAAAAWTSKPIYTKSWADWSDSEDEDNLPGPVAANYSREVVYDSW
jgi:hypothetical protein